MEMGLIRSIVCRFSLASFCLLLALSLPVKAQESETTLISLCYHDIRDDVRGDLDVDAMVVSTRQLVRHFEWLKQNGYQPISLKQWQDAQSALDLPEDRSFVSEVYQNPQADENGFRCPQRARQMRWVAPPSQVQRHAQPHAGQERQTH